VSARPRLVCVGLAVVDLVAHLDATLTVGVKQFASSLTTTFGGPATTAAAAAARLDVDVDLVAPVGDDQHAVALADALALAGVGHEGLVVRRGMTSATSLVVVSGDGERTIVNATPPALLAPPERQETAAIEVLVARADAVLVDVRWPAAARIVLIAARERGIPALLDLDRTPSAHRDEVRELAALASHVVASQDALADVLDAADMGEDGGSDALAALAVLARDGMVGVTLGAQGMRWRDASGGASRAGTVAAFEVAVVETLGAGDVWHGAFAAALARGLDIDDAATDASAAAALRCTRRGGWETLPHADEVSILRTTARR